MSNHVINAENRKLGRVASEAAVLLMGKHTPEFARNIVPNVKVVVENASKLSIDDKKRDTKVYKNFSGYPGGLKQQVMKKVLDKKGYQEVLRKAVYGMLPKNKLRSVMIKNLTVKE